MPLEIVALVLLLAASGAVSIALWAAGRGEDLKSVFERLDRWGERLHLSQKGPMRYEPELNVNAVMLALMAAALGVLLYWVGLGAAGAARVLAAIAVFVVLGGLTVYLGVAAWHHTRRSWNARELLDARLGEIWAAVGLAGFITCLTAFILLRA
jgi:uncharacterized membrane protein YidH (DUF202 family)